MYLRFSRHLFRTLWLVRTVVLAQAFLILLGALAISAAENVPLGEAVYFSFVTALTIGYGDIVATTALGRTIAILICLIGILFTGLVVASAVHSLQQSVRELQSQKTD